MMNDIDLGAFSALFQEACFKCFGHAVVSPLTETEAKLFYNKVFEATGLVIGWKSIKNYSAFLFSSSSGGRSENPSVATLDTLTRYVAGAPFTSEPERKAEAGHYPFWYGYREQWVAGRAAASDTAGPRARRRVWWFAGGVAGVVAVVGLVWVSRGGMAESFRDDFHALSMDSLAARGWWVSAPDTFYWNRRADWNQGLTLYTMEGDNWPDPIHRPVMRNLLLRRVPCAAFTLEWHFDHFIPHQNWQQAGVLLSEDTGFDSRSLRVSLAYNDYNGVYPRSGMILLQAIVSRAGAKPEEIAHVPLFLEDSLRRNPELMKDLEYSALRIVKEGEQLRILYADGILANTSFRQIASYQLPLDFHYVGLFATKGYVDSSAVMPVRFSYFSLDCEKRK